MRISQNKIGIGTVQFGLNYGISNSEGQTSIGEVSRILNFASKNNIQYLDTAYSYGTAEEILGKHDLSDFRIVSKYIPNESIGIDKQLEISLKRLNVNSLYGYLAHRPLDLILENEKKLNILYKFRDRGMIQKIGASFNDVEEVQVFLDKNIELDIIQVPYNYLDRRFENVIKELRLSGCEIHTRSTFLQGLFFCNIETLDSFFDDVKPVLKRIQELTDLPAQLLKFVIEKDFIDVVNIGVNNLEQLKGNLKDLQQAVSTLPHLEIAVKPQILMPSEWP